MHTIEQAIETLQNHRPIIVVDDASRENEGDIIYPASLVDAEAITFMLQHGSGIICLPLPGEHLDRLRIPLMVKSQDNSSRLGTNFTVSIESKHGVSTGVSAADRAHTIATAIAPQTEAHDIAMPGHIFPLRAHPEGLRARRGHTEAALDIVTLAGFNEAAVLCEVMNPDGTMARLTDLERFAAEHDLAVISIEALCQYRGY